MLNETFSVLFKHCEVFFSVQLAKLVKLSSLSSL